MFIKIISVPPGDAPDFVRRHWLGKILHAIDKSDVGTWGVMSGEEQGEHECYRVFVDQALESLPPSIAEWWRTYCPHMIGRVFAFDSCCCQEVESPN
jgi:hypothetical protein